MPPKKSGRVHKFIVGTGEIQEGRSVDTIQLFLPDGSAIDLGGGAGSGPEEIEVWSTGQAYAKGTRVQGPDDIIYLARDDLDEETNVDPPAQTILDTMGYWYQDTFPQEPAPPAFSPQGPWVAGDYPAGSTVLYDNGAWWASTDTTEDDVPGVTGAPLTPDDLFSTVWAEAGEVIFDTSTGSTVGASDDPWAPDVYSTVLYVPVTHTGHMQIALDTFDDHYVGYYLIKGSNMSLQGTGQSDNSIGFDFDAVGDWYIQLFQDPGDASNHDAGQVVGTVVLSSGLTLTPAPADNPWVLFANG